MQGGSGSNGVGGAGEVSHFGATLTWCSFITTAGMLLQFTLEQLVHNLMLS